MSWSTTFPCTARWNSTVSRCGVGIAINDRFVTADIEVDDQLAGTAECGAGRNLECVVGSRRGIGIDEMQIDFVTGLEVGDRIAIGIDDCTEDEVSLPLSP